MTNSPNIVEMPYREILQWASQNGIKFKGVDELGSVNRRRVALGLPQVRIALDRQPWERDTAPTPEADKPARIGRPKSGRTPEPEPALAADPHEPEASPEPVETEVPSVEAERLPAIAGRAQRTPMRKDLRGLTDVLFDTLDRYRQGDASLDEVRVVCDVSGKIATLIHAQVKLQNTIERAQNREVATQLRRLAGTDAEEAA